MSMSTSTSRRTKPSFLGSPDELSYTSLDSNPLFNGPGLLMVLDLEAERLVDEERFTELLINWTVGGVVGHNVDEALHIWSIGGTAPLNNGEPHLFPDVVHHIKWLRGSQYEIRLEQQINDQA